MINNIKKSDFLQGIPNTYQVLFYMFYVNKECNMSHQEYLTMPSLGLSPVLKIH